MSGRRAGRAAAYGLMIGASALWVIPLLFALYVSFRPYSETSQYGYVSLPHTLTLSNYLNAWTQADLPRFFINSVEITVPAVILFDARLEFETTRTVRGRAAPSWSRRAC